MVAHSDGINAFLDLFAPGKASQFKTFAYCCTVAVELHAIRSTEDDGSPNLGLGNFTVINNWVGIILFQYFKVKFLYIY